MLNRLPTLLACLSLCSAGASELLQVKVVMRDGVGLSTSVFLPAASGRFPVALQRTPYGKVTRLTTGIKSFLDHGYAVVSQDVRGRHDSEGEFHQFVQETNDGQDTLVWISKQKWSDGRVGMFGGSYVGLTQYLAALNGNPTLRAIAPAVCGADDYLDRFYSRGGPFRLGHRWLWMEQNFRQPGRKPVELRTLFTYLPERNADKFLIGRTLDFYQAAMSHPSYDGYWKSLSLIDRASSIKTPAMIESGWYDSFAEGDLDMWSALRAAGVAARALIGPWGHNLSPVMAEADFGPTASLPLRRLEIEWFDAYVTKSAPPPASLVRYFVMGANEWRESEVWPPRGFVPTPLYLHSARGANSLNGDGKLLHQPERKNHVDRFAYDPRNAVPTVGGALCCDVNALPWGPRDQRRVEGRRDVLVYTSEPLREPVEVTGAPKTVLFVSSSAPDTDFTAKLVDVWPDGTAKILCDGILRMRYRKGVSSAVSYRPGSVERIEIPMGVTSNLFQAGHRIRLDVSSSNFPRFDRNLNTGRPVAGDKELRTAQQQVFHGKNTLSHLILPLSK